SAGTLRREVYRQTVGGQRGRVVVRGAVDLGEGYGAPEGLVEGGAGGQPQIVGAQAAGAVAAVEELEPRGGDERPAVVVGAGIDRSHRDRGKEGRIQQAAGRARIGGSVHPGLHRVRSIPVTRAIAESVAMADVSPVVAAAIAAAIIAVGG